MTGMKQGLGADVGVQAEVIRQAGMQANLGLRSTYEFECIGPIEEKRDYYLELQTRRDALLALREKQKAEGLPVRRLLETDRQVLDLFDEMRSLEEVKWTETVPNIVVNVGLNDVLDKYFKGSAYTAAWYVGIKTTGSIVAGDTMASHAGWAESTVYSEAVRQTLTLGTVAAQSVDNTASKASFSINGTATITGAFIATDSTKGGSTGTLYGGAEFAASKAVTNGDTLNVTVTLTAASA